MSIISTPHISADPADFGKTVLMPGDPLRAKFIAENFLTDAKLVNNIRGVQGHTGMWKGVPISVMASGMGIPSISLYSWELFHFFDVDNIIRVGTAGALSMDLKPRDLIAAIGACTDSNIARSFGVEGYFAPVADFRLLCAANEAAKEKGIELHVGNVLSSDAFYSAPEANRKDMWRNMNVLAVEMETAGLYANAAYARKAALCICTISDHLYKDSELTAQERQTSLYEMIEVALDTAVKMEA